jgi:hypothetical protein
LAGSSEKIFFFRNVVLMENFSAKLETFFLFEKRHQALFASMFLP